MAYYRLYHISDGHFCRVEELSAEDDVQAVRQAGMLLETGAAELWSGKRRVKTFGKPSPNPARADGLAESAQSAR